MRGALSLSTAPLLAAACLLSACAESTDTLDRRASLTRSANAFLSEEAAAQPAANPPAPPPAPRDLAPPIIRGV